MSEEDPISYPTINFDQQDVGEDMESIFTIEDDFDALRACQKLVSREKSSEKYVLGDKIAQGGMGGIYQVYDRDLKRTSVLKIILPKIMANRQMFLNFIDEARISAQLEHPNIIPVHDLGVIDDDRLYFSMKKIEGEELSAVLKRLRDGDPETEKKYDLYHLLNLFRKVCDAMAFAHSKDIIHRDIKPDNIMVGSYGEALLVDWGLARKLGEPERAPDDGEGGDPLSDAIGDRKPTRYGMIKGTPAFMPPEMAKGSADEIDKRSDIYLLGSTLYAIATLCAPFRGEDVIEIIDNAENGDFEHPQERAPHREMPAELVRIILKGMEYEADDRYQTVDELIEDLDDLLAGRTASEQRMFQEGEHLMVQGEGGEECYVIIEGRVQVYMTIAENKQIVLSELSDGDCIGEMALIANASRSASVIALVDTTVVVITEELLRRGLDKLPPWMGNVVQTIVERLRTANSNVHPLIYSSCAYHVLNQLWMVYMIWGTPAEDEESGNRLVILDFDMAVREITTNTGVTRERVTDVLSKIVDTNLVLAYDESHIYIPNLDLYRQFIAYILDQQTGIDAPFRGEPRLALYSNNQELVISRALVEGESEPSELEAFYKYEVKELLGFDTAGEIWARFDDIILELDSR